MKLDLTRTDGINHFFNKPINSRYATKLTLLDNTELDYYPQVLFDYVDTEKLDEDQVLNIIQNYDADIVKQLIEILHYGKTKISSNAYEIKNEGNQLIELLKLLHINRIDEQIRLKIICITKDLIIDYKTCFEILGKQHGIEFFKTDNHTYDNLIDIETSRNKDKFLESLQQKNEILPKITYYLKNPNFTDAIKLFSANIANKNFDIFFNILDTIRKDFGPPIYKYELTLHNKVKELFKDLLEIVKSNDLVTTMYDTGFANTISSLLSIINKSTYISHIAVKIIFQLDFPIFEYFFKLPQVKKIISKKIEENNYSFTYEQLITTFKDFIKYLEIEDLKEKDNNYRNISQMLGNINRNDPEIIISIITAYINDKFNLNDLVIVYKFFNTDCRYCKEYDYSVYVTLYKQHKCNVNKLRSHVQVEMKKLIENSGGLVKPAIKKCY